MVGKRFMKKCQRKVNRLRLYQLYPDHLRLPDFTVKLDHVFMYVLTKKSECLIVDNKISFCRDPVTYVLYYYRKLSS